MRAVVVESKGAEARILETNEDELLAGAGEDATVDIDVRYSSYNYKDGMAIAGRGILRQYPGIPGIDIVGTVTSSGLPEWSVGDEVVLNGDGIGELLPGGFATRARVRPDALVRLPEAVSPVRAAAIGTAGFTAMLSVLKLEDAGIRPEDGNVLVTGAAGGVGSIAILLLARAGYRVVASSGRKDEQGEYLRWLGASDIIDRHELSDAVGKPLQSERWAGAVDSVGSTTLVNVLAQTKYGGTVAACGLAQGADLPGTVLPYILRGVTLTGANSVNAPRAARQRAWDALAERVDFGKLDELSTTISLADTIPYAEEILAGRIRGRTVVDVLAP
ncbi:MDR family oxidoreductase [Gulosibacter molinativorax]|uniref:Oxidoreductase n=1 Tax=Gulosibacter molinativorax TaxID=256821 RepID=A0ABT7CA58_9MICO|nr:MDR family oxidoreductase [Gulosibacter molinativorax]MDJ1372096.1 oxidoreductase [Gulosibacter molinativorax]QUY62360.1 Alcohol dehydrogenase [Gulosibacter molinativorax]